MKTPTLRRSFGLSSVRRYLGSEVSSFVSIREIQPFYNALDSSEHVQTILISHHPTLMSLMAVDKGVVFSRGVNSPVRVEPFRAPAGTLLTASELVARGYFDEPA